jgi:hypothetical protein
MRARPSRFHADAVSVLPGHWLSAFALVAWTSACGGPDGSSTGTVDVDGEADRAASGSDGGGPPTDVADTGIDGTSVVDASQDAPVSPDVGSPATCQPGSRDAGMPPACTGVTNPSAATALLVDVSANLGPATHVAAGGLEGLAVGTPNAIVAPLHPKVFTQAAEGTSRGLNPTADALTVAPQAARLGATVEMRFADAIDSYPYVWPGWTQWLSFVDQMVSARLKATSVTNIEGYELWNEPNLNWNTAAAGPFNAGWIRTLNEVRTLDRATPTVGPSFSRWDAALMLAFLTSAKASNAVPEVVSWHELQGSIDVSAHVAAYRAIEVSLGISPRPISINEYARTIEEGIPGDLIGYIAKFERTGVDHACLGNWFPPLGSFDGLIVNGNQPNGAWWLYKWYGDMTGSMLSTTAATQSGLEGVASLDRATQVISVVFGGASGAGDVHITGLDGLSCYGNGAQATLESVPSPGRTVAVAATTTASVTTVPVCNGAITIHLGTMAAANGYHLLIRPAP